MQITEKFQISTKQLTLMLQFFSTIQYSMFSLKKTKTIIGWK